MTHRVTSLSLAGLALLVGVSYAPNAAAHLVALAAARVAASDALGTASRSAAASDQSATPAEIIAVNTRGTAKNESTDPARVTYTFPLYSLTAGQQVGTGIDDATCISSTPPPCGVVDDIATFHLPQGDIVSHALLGVAPDPLRPGFILVGSRPAANTIIKATGAYSGRTGRVRLSGGDDMRQFPMTLIQDDFWVIELS